MAKSHKFRFVMFALLLTAALGNSSSAQYKRCAVLVKEGKFVTSDQISAKEPGRYGPKDNLDGPALENKYFAPFCPVMGSHIYLDCIGKRQHVPVLANFGTDTKRHYRHAWGEDIWRSGGSPKPGTACFGALVNGEVVSPQWDNIKSLKIEIVSDKPEDTEIKFTFKDWQVGGKTVNAVWTLSTHWEARWIKHRFQVSADFGYALVFGTTKHLGDDGYVKDTAKATLHGLGTENTYDSLNDRQSLIALKSAQANFKGYFSNTILTGIVTAPDKNGLVTAWHLVSWAEESAPLFKQENWQSLLFNGIAAD